MQAISSSGASTRLVAPAAHRGVTISPMIRINIKDGQISSRRFHPTSHQQQQNEAQHKGAAALLPGNRRQRVIASSSAAAGGAAFNSDAGGSKSNYTDCTISLTKAIIGAGQLWLGGCCTPSSSRSSKRQPPPQRHLGCTRCVAAVIAAPGMMPIPYAFNLLGFGLGSAMLVGVALVSYWTMAIMVQVGGSWDNSLAAEGVGTGSVLHIVRVDAAAPGSPD